jgi:hypothetical protein
MRWFRRDDVSYHVYFDADDHVFVGAQGDKEVVMAALEQNGLAIDFVARSLLNDRVGF